MGLFLSLLLPNIALSQIGITTGEKIETYKANSGNGFDTGVKGGSALEQLENIAGQKVSSGNTDHHTVTPAQRPTNVANTISQAALFQNAVKMQIASGLASAFIGMIFSSGSTQKSPQAIEAERRQAAILAARAEAERRYNDSIAQARYEKMMESYKVLSTNMIKLKTLIAGDIEFKPLDMKPAPMSREDIERQNLLRQGLKIGWDNNAWAQVPPNSYKMEESNAPAESGPDQYLEAAINKIETFQGGRVAALAGRYMLNIKKETMSYLKDASDAAISGNIARMDEVGNVDLRAKISSNALYKTGVQTAKSYAEQGKDFISGEIDDAKDAANFALMESKGMELLKNKNIYSHVSDDWKVGLRKY